MTLGSPMSGGRLTRLEWLALAGLLLLAGLSFFIARAQGIAPWKVIGEHIVIALCVVVLTHAVGDWVASYVADGGP